MCEDKSGILPRLWAGAWTCSVKSSVLKLVRDSIALESAASSLWRLISRLGSWLKLTIENSLDTQRSGDNNDQDKEINKDPFNFN